MLGPAVGRPMKGTAMMRKLILLMLAAGLAAAGAAGAAELGKPAKHPNSSKWASLFKPDLSDAIFPKGVWSWENGELTATQDQCIWTQKEYENFVLDLEFKCGDAANSGVVVYCTDTNNWIPNSVELQILDDYAKEWKDAPANWKCASVFGHLPPVKQTVKKAGEWNRMTVTCKGPKIQILLNGVFVTECDMKQFTSAKKNPDGSDVPAWLSRPMAELATKGRIGLQGKHGGAPIFFRNVRIKELK